MTKKEILSSLKELQELVFVVSMQKMTISSPDEFADYIEKISKKVIRLKKDVEETLEK